MLLKRLFLKLDAGTTEVFSDKGLLVVRLFWGCCYYLSLKPSDTCFQLCCSANVLFPFHVGSGCTGWLFSDLKIILSNYKEERVKGFYL